MDLLGEKKRIGIFFYMFLHLKNLSQVLKEDQILKFDIKEDKEKLQAINLKKV